MVKKAKGTEEQIVYFYMKILQFHLLFNKLPVAKKSSSFDGSLKVILAQVICLWGLSKKTRKNDSLAS